MSADVSRPKHLCTIKNGVSGGRKIQGRNEKKPSAIGRLNDFCWLQIFNHLDLEDLLNLADVNNQFKRVSEMSFARRYAKFIYPDDMWDYESGRSLMRPVLCKFGKSIKSMTFFDEWDEYPAELDAIPQFCAGGILEELHLITSKMMKDDDCARLLFSSLKTLTLNCDEFNAHVGMLFSECQELKTLRLLRIPRRRKFISDVAQKYRKLEYLYICDVNSRTTRALLGLNPQIKKLEIEAIRDTTLPSISNMVHLEELYIIKDMFRENCSNNIAKLAGLKKLKVLELHFITAKSFTAIIGAMQNVHSLVRFGCFGSYHHWQYVGQIGKLKTLKSLTLNFPVLLLSYSDLTKLGGQFPLLHELKLKLEFPNDQTIENLIRFIELSTTLEVLEIYTNQPERFNQHFYNGLLTLIQRRESSNTFKVTVYCYHQGYQPIEVALNMFSNLLEVEFNYHWGLH